jgi:hypothetical protein
LREVIFVNQLKTQGYYDRCHSYFMREDEEEKMKKTDKAGIVP